MRILNRQSLAALAILGSLAVAPDIVQAGDGAPAGVIRISDNQIAPIPEPNTLPMPVSNGRIVSTGNGAYFAGYHGGCDGGCNGNCGSGCGHKGCGCGRLLSAMFCPWGGCSHSPDHGWCYPQKVPMNRVPVVYRRYWPTKWYGQAGHGMAKGMPVYPMVYMPTDTTQLGFYYQRVPQWRPNPGMLPPRPIPSNYHIRCGHFGHYGHHGVIEPAPVVAPQPIDSNGVPPEPKTLNKSASKAKRGTARN